MTASCAPAQGVEAMAYNHSGPLAASASLVEVACNLKMPTTAGTCSDPVQSDLFLSKLI